MDEVSIGIVTYNNEDVIHETLDCLKNHFSGKVYLIDNCSTDSTPKILEDFANINPNTELIVTSDNIGFGRAHNTVLAQLKSKYHIIYNPDVRIYENIFPQLTKFMEEHPDAAISIPKILNEDGSTQYGNKQYPSVLDLFLRRFWPNKLKHFVQNRLDYYEMKYTGYDKVYEIPSLSGCFMFCKTSFLKETNGFDPRYFMYFEDIDLGFEARKRGYKTLFNPNVSVTHLWQRASSKNYRMAYIMITHAFKFFNKWGWKLF